MPSFKDSYKCNRNNNNSQSMEVEPVAGSSLLEIIIAYWWIPSLNL